MASLMVVQQIMVQRITTAAVTDDQRHEATKLQIFIFTPVI